MNSNPKKPYTTVLAIVLLVAAAVSPNEALASMANYLRIGTAEINTSGLDAIISTNGTIPGLGTFGYGIITSAGLDAVVVAMTNHGILKNLSRGFAAGQDWHTHLVHLGIGLTGLCGTNPEVQTISLQQPGRVTVVGNTVILQEIPFSFTGVDALTGDSMTLIPGHNVQNVVSFMLDPKFQAGNLKAICVEDITPAEHIIKNNSDIVDDLVNMVS